MNICIREFLEENRERALEEKDGKSRVRVLGDEKPCERARRDRTVGKWREETLAMHLRLASRARRF